MQNKFLKQDTKLLAFVEKSIKNEIKRRNFRFDHEVFNIKHLTECPRRIMYRVNATPQNDYEFLTYNHEHYTKKKWVDFFERCQSVKVLDRNVLAADCNYNVVGWADVILEIRGSATVLQIESLESDQYKKVKTTGGLRQQIVEMMMIMWLTEVANGVILCENKTTNEYFLSHVVPYKPILESARNKCLELMEQKLLQQLPKRAYEDNQSIECKSCEYKETCWNQKEIVDAEEKKAN